MTIVVLPNYQENHVKYKIVRNSSQKDKFDIMQGSFGSNEPHLQDQKAIFQLLTYEQAAVIIEGLMEK